MPPGFDPLAIANFGLSALTAACALYLSYAALAHTAKPRISVRLASPTVLSCSEQTIFMFEFDNVGYWYGRPMATNLVVYCNFAPEFQLHEVRYGSGQELVSSEVRPGTGGVNYLKAKGITLTHGESPEGVHVRATTPSQAGRYAIRITASSENGASLSKVFGIRTVIGPPEPARRPDTTADRGKAQEDGLAD